MSTARTRLAAVALTAAVTGAIALSPASAQAASVPTAPLTINITGPSSNWAPIRPGSKDVEHLDVEVVNSSADAQPFTGAIVGHADGALSLATSDISLSVTPGQGTPATETYVGPQDGDLFGSFFPKGSSRGSQFTVPAHSSLDWQIAIAANSSWPVNDSGMLLTLGGAGPSDHKSIDIPIGRDHTGGPVLETLSPGSALAPGKPLDVTLTITNKTGATITSPWSTHLSYGAEGPDEHADDASLTFEVWSNGSWVPVEGSPLASIPAGFANGTSHSYKLRVQVTSYHAATASTHIGLFVDSGARYPSVGIHRDLTVSRTAPSTTATPTAGASGPTHTPSGAPSGPNGSATASASATASPSTAAGTGSASPSSTLTQIPAAGSLAHTGSSNTGTFVGLALVLLGAGTAVLVGLRRRARRQ